MKTYKRRGGFLLVTLIRTIILYLVIIVSLRIMGKRQIGQLQPSELVKIAFIITFSKHLSEVKKVEGFNDFKNILFSKHSLRALTCLLFFNLVLLLYVLK